MMEVPGRKPGATFYCDPCNGEGESNDAGGYCKQCREYLCKPCIKAHRRHKMSKTHDILVDDDMPRSRLPPDHDDYEMTETCETHTKTKEPLKFYCPTHDDVGCGDCIVLTHRNCKVDYIADAAKGFKDSRDFKDLLLSVSDLEERIRRCGETIKETSKSNTEVKQTALEGIRKFRAEILAYLDQREEELVKEIETIKADDDKRIGNMQAEYENTKKMFEEIKIEIKSKRDSVNQIFISAKRNKAKLRDLKTSLDDTALETKSVRRNYKFKPNTTIEKIITAKTPLGAIDNTALKTLDLVNATCTPCGDFAIRTTDDATVCIITGIALFALDKIVLADCNNKAVKMVDTTTKKVISRLQLLDHPFDLTVISTNEIAVTMFNTKVIRIIRVHNDQLSEVRKFAVSDACRGIDFQLGKLAVIYNAKNNIEIMDTKGVISSVIKCDQINGSDGYLTWTGQGQDLFVKGKNNKILKLSLQGNILASYSDSDLDDPYGMTVTRDGKLLVCGYSSDLDYPYGITVTRDGKLLVCGYNSNNIHVISEDAQKIRVLVSKQDGLCRPQSICLSEDTGMLYVGGFGKDVLKVYKLQ